MAPVCEIPNDAPEMENDCHTLLLKPQIFSKLSYSFSQYYVYESKVLVYRKIDVTRFECQTLWKGSTINDITAAGKGDTKIGNLAGGI